MKKTLFICLVIIGLASTLPACKVHQIEVQQGNIITKDMVSELRIGMTKNQVKFILGTPLASDPFDPDHWAYVYILSVPGKKPEHKKLGLTFENDKLKAFSGDYAKSDDSKS